MRRRRVISLTVLVVAVGAVVATWLFAATHPVLPGIAGCGWVRDLDARIECLSTRIDASVRADGVEATTDDVDRLVADGAIGQECHVAWHPTGERLGRRAAAADRDLQTLQSTSWCTQGHDHGFLIGYLESSDVDPSSEELERTCMAIAADGPINCVHAFGHAFARATDGDLDEVARRCTPPVSSDLPAAAKRTELELRDECLSGAAMERALDDRARGVTSVRARDCADLDDVARTFCVGYATTRASMLGDDRSDAEVCAAVASGRDDRATCMSHAAPA